MCRYVSSEQKGYDVIYNLNKQPLQARHHVKRVQPYGEVNNIGVLKPKKEGERRDERMKYTNLAMYCLFKKIDNTMSINIRKEIVKKMFVRLSHYFQETQRKTYQKMHPTYCTLDQFFFL